MHAQVVIAILLMATVTYLTRIIGFLALRGRDLSPRMKNVLEAIPGCVLISVIAPYFSTTKPQDIIPLAITVLASARFSLLPTVCIAIVSAGLLRHL